MTKVLPKWDTKIISHGYITVFTCPTILPASLFTFLLACQRGRTVMHHDYLETGSMKVILLPGEWLFNRPFIPQGWIFCQGWSQWHRSQAPGDIASKFAFTGAAAEASPPALLDSWTDKYWSTDWCLIQSQAHRQINVSESRRTGYTLQISLPMILDIQQKLHLPNLLFFPCVIHLQCFVVLTSTCCYAIK